MSKSITQMLRDYARDHTTTTYHDALICKAATEIEFHEERWDQLRQQLAALRDHQVAYETETEQQLASRDAEVAELRNQLQEVCNAIGSTEYMDPPDGGSVTISEQVNRMREDRNQLRQQLAKSQKRAFMLREAIQAWADSTVREELLRPSSS